MTFGPIRVRWDDDVFVPLGRFKGELRVELTVDEVYTITEVAERNMKLHGGYFARLAESFDSLPEEWGGFFKDVEHLRKWCLIHTGYCSQENIVFDTPDDAARCATHLRKLDQEFRVVTITGNIVTIYTAESQQVRRNGKGMDKDRFANSVRAVEHHIEGMLGIRK